MENLEESPVIVQPLSKEEKELNAKLKKLQPELEKASAEENRRNAYQRISDPIYFQWQRGEKTEQDYLDAVAQVKKDYPVPGEGEE
jgi:hypothetical protein